MEDKASAYWTGVRRLRKLCRKRRKERALRQLPAIQEICSRAAIEIREVQHGLQFLKNEYIINWAPGTNKVSVQYRLSGHQKTLPFTKEGQPDKPRIIVALEELIELVRVEGRHKPLQ
jgi:hypothetical protein